MKTLLSLTSRKPLVRIFLKETVGGSLPEGVSIDKAKGVILCTREALGKLGNWCKHTANVLGLTLAVGSGVNVALAQESPKTTEGITVATLNLPVQTQLAQVNPTTTGNTEASLPQNIEDGKNTVKIPIETLISVLESANPPKTVEAAEFIVGLDEETRAMILGKKLPKESLFIKGYEELNTPTSENHLTLLPPLSAVKHIQKGNTLAGELQEYLKDPNINANNIGDISDEILANMGEKNPDLFDQVLAYNEEGVQVSSDLLAYTLEMERITTARADRSEILYKKSVVELEAVNAELVKARGALEGATRLLAALQGLKM